MAVVQLLWDASGFVKRYSRYYGETGQASDNVLFGIAPLQRMFITPWGYAETYSTDVTQQSPRVETRG